MANTQIHTIRVDDDTWARWDAATRDVDHVDSVSELIRVAVERYLEPDAERERLRASIGAMSLALMDIRSRVDDTLLEAIAKPVAELSDAKRKRRGR